ncbi:hypothetical protein OHB01_20285 [Microbispora hainanensis]|uniref:Uncharacterized protein n=1 Tax=Microbispora hainanensis TaxID=568844 RepID=A0ABZ1T206_9ACTN|nr:MULTISPECIES: hypothetical protein [Microbispora]
MRHIRDVTARALTDGGVLSATSGTAPVPAAVPGGGGDAGISTR